MNIFGKFSGRHVAAATGVLVTCLIPVGTANAQTAPTPPSGLQVTATANNTFLVTWSDNSNNETGFEVTDGISSRRTAANATADNWHVTPGTYKCFRVRAFNGDGSSAWYPDGTYVCGTTSR
jgi:hypothetical protein